MVIVIELVLKTTRNRDWSTSYPILFLTTAWNLYFYVFQSELIQIKIFWFQLVRYE